MVADVTAVEDGIDSSASLRPAVIVAVVCSAASALYGAAHLDPLPIVGIALSAAPVIAAILWLQKVRGAPASLPFTISGCSSGSPGRLRCRGTR